MSDKMNKNRKLMHDLNGVADKFVTEAAPKKKALNIRMPWVYIGGAATAAAVLIMVGLNLPERSDNEIYAPAATDITTAAVTESITDFTVTEKPATAQKIIVTVPSSDITGNVSESVQNLITSASVSETAKQTEKKQENSKPSVTEKKPEVTEKAETTVSTEYGHMEDIQSACISSVTKNPDGSIRLVIRNGQFAIILPASWDGHFVATGHNANNYDEMPSELAVIALESKLAYQDEHYSDASLISLHVSADPGAESPYIGYKTTGYSGGEYLRLYSSCAVDRFECSEEAYAENLALYDTFDQIIYESYSEETGKLEREYNAPDYTAEATSGACGKNTKWIYDTDSRTLRISMMSDDEMDWGAKGQPHSIDLAPWKEMKWYKDIENVVVEEDIGCVGINSFDNCTSLKSFTCPDEVVWISATTFQNCTSLTSITLPEKLEAVLNCTFEGCTNLKEVKLGNCLTEIQHGAFKDCTSLKVLDIPESVTAISDYAFRNCSPDLVLRCREGSYVQQYAEDHGIKFEAITE
ncbi:MAG: leucine-rich repeat domain-containing protein [Oscillospiraceae bacterium]|nr:leucine-rich repeat domain-containing protein [Oscillospiraceae bacterium]